MLVLAIIFGGAFAIITNALKPNGGISGRDVGAPITNAALRMIMQKQYETSDYNLNYTGQLANGKTIRDLVTVSNSSSIRPFISD